MESGKQLAHYTVLAAIGKGGMGEVWRARDTKLGREVAIKTLPEEFARDADRRARFEREAKLLASLNHPNIAAIYGLEEAEGTRFLVLELVEGDTLADRLQHGALPVEESLKLALQVAEALEAAHDKGIVHRDLKPANIKVTPEGKVKVLDFGLAKAFAGERAEVSLSNSPTISVAATQHGVILGTAAYMSPEQAEGKDVDRKADIWAFGVVLFEMLTGRNVFAGQSISRILAAVLTSEPEWSCLPPNLHPQIRMLLERCLEKESRDRLSGISDARVGIQKVLADPAGVLTRPAMEVEAAWHASQVRWIAAILLATVVTGIAGWNLKPAPVPAPLPVSRFPYVLADRMAFTDLRGSPIALSPDGSRMVFVADNQLYIKRMDSLEATVIPGTNEMPGSPFFSPDGEWIGYWAGGNASGSLGNPAGGSYSDIGQLKKTAVSGGRPMTLCESPVPYGPPSWGRDDRIVWGHPKGLMSISANGGTCELLIEAKGTGNIGNPQVLPGGQWVLYALGDARTAEVMVESLATKESKRLFPGTVPRYLPTGHLVYGMGDVLFAVPFDLNTLQTTGKPVPLVEGVRTDPPKYTVSDSGALAYLPGERAGQTLSNPVWVDRSGTAKSALTSGSLVAAQNPRLSPTGRQFAITLEGNVWVYYLDGRPPIKLTFESETYSPLWTPDGQRLIFEKGSRAANTTHLLAIPADGSIAEGKPVSPEGHFHPYGWFEDGSKLIAVRLGNNEGGDVVAWPLDKPDAVEPIVQSPGRDGFDGTAVSPDRRWLAYTTDRTGGLEVWVKPLAGEGGARRISPAGGVEPVWSRDGKELYYLEGQRMMAVPVTLGNQFSFGSPKMLFEGNFLRSSQPPSYDVAADGRFLMLAPAAETSAESARPQINIVLNWFEELKARVTR